MKKSFGSDNHSGVHPAIMDAIVSANANHVPAYGEDPYTKKADEYFAAIFGEDINPFFVFNGTGANIVALQASTNSFHAVVCAETGHINVDECGAPTKFTGCMLLDIPTPDGKLTPELIQTKLHALGDQHHAQPKVIYISQSTELGTVYTPDEIKALCNLAHQHQMYVHMDGSRLANACAYLGLGLRELSRDCRVDILSLGGTKNGMMLGEAIIAFRPELNQNLKYIRKQSAQLYSKMRFLSAQYIAYLENELWLKNASHANRMASLLAEHLQTIPQIRLTQKVEANEVFLIMPQELISKMRETYFFYTWNEEINEVRLVCSWDTEEKDVHEFISLLKSGIRS